MTKLQKSVINIVNLTCLVTLLGCSSTGTVIPDTREARISYTHLFPIGVLSLKSHSSVSYSFVSPYNGGAGIHAVVHSGEDISSNLPDYPIAVTLSVNGKQISSYAGTLGSLTFTEEHDGVHKWHWYIPLRGVVLKRNDNVILQITCTPTSSENGRIDSLLLRASKPRDPYW